MICKSCKNEFSPRRKNTVFCDVCKQNGIHVLCVYCGESFTMGFPTYNSYVNGGREIAHGKCLRAAKMSDPEYAAKISAVRSEQAKKVWSKEGHREKQSESHKAAWTEDMKKKQSETVTERFADPEERVKQSERITAYFADYDKRVEMSRKVKQTTDSAEWRALQSERVKLAWEDPEYREKQTMRIRELWKDPEVKKKHAATISSLWDDPVYRKNFLDKAMARRELVREELLFRRDFVTEVPDWLVGVDASDKEAWQRAVDWITKHTGRCSRTDLVEFTGYNYHTVCDAIQKLDVRGVVSSRSLFQSEVVQFIQSFYNGVIEQDKYYDFLVNSSGNKMQLDVYIPELKVGIEVNGTYWHSEVAGKGKYYHFNKSKQCREAGVRLIHVWGYEWNDPKKQLVLKSIIKSALGATKRIYARDLFVTYRTSLDMREFFDTNNIQGFRAGEFAICLEDKSGEVWMSYMVGKGNHMSRKYSYEIVRGASKLGYTVVGGSSKLMAALFEDKKLSEIVYYVEYNHFSGLSLIRDSRWKLISEQVSFKNYWVKEGRIKNREPRRHAEIMKMYESGEVWRIWDAGTATYLYTVNSD